MDEKRLDRITTNLGSFIRVFQIMKGRSEASGIKPIPLDPKYSLLGLLRTQSLPMSELGRRLVRSKPNMTALVDGLIEDGLVRRLPDDDDRRIVLIELTEKGRKVMEERRQTAKACIRTNLASLSEKDLDDLCESFENINRIIAKLGSD